MRLEMLQPIYEEWWKRKEAVRRANRREKRIRKKERKQKEKMLPNSKIPFKIKLEPVLLENFITKIITNYLFNLLLVPLI